MNQPLYKQPVLWIAVVLAVVTGVSVAVWTIGMSGSRPASTPPPVSTAAPAPPMEISRPVAAPPPATGSRKVTYAWQTLTNSVPFAELPTQVAVLPADPAARESWSMRGSQQAIGINMPLANLFSTAYPGTSAIRMVFPGDLPGTKFDYIANLPTGSLEALQTEIKKQLGLAGTKETRQMDAYALVFDHTNAPGLTPGSTPRRGTASNPPAARRPGFTARRNITIATFAQTIENRLGRPVLDQTGLTGRYDVNYPTVPLNSPDMDTVNQGFKESLGLALVATNTGVEVLVIKKAN